MQHSINYYKMKILFWHRKNKNNLKNEAPIYCRITVNGIRTDFSTNIFCKIGCFNTKKQEIDNDHILNLRLTDIKQKINAIYLDLSIKNKHITSDILKDYLTGKTSNSCNMTELLCLFQEHRHDLLKINDISFATYRKTTFYIKNILTFLKCKKIDKLDINQFNGKLANELYTWLQFKQHSLTHSARTLKFLNSAFNYAISTDIMKHNPIQSLRFKRGPNKKIEFLNDNELERLKKYRFASIRLQEVADLFLFQCYTGLSYADLFDFDINKNIETDIKGRQWIIKNRNKNGHESVLPFSSNAKMLIEKYNNKFPVISNQKYNAYLKEIGEILGFTIKLTTHIGRKTFGTIALNEGYSIESVSRMLGHSSIKTTQSHYAVVLRKRIANEN